MSDVEIIRNLGLSLAIPISPRWIEVHVADRSVKPSNVDFCVEVDGQAVGCIELTGLRREGFCTLFYWIGKEYQGRGLMTRTLKHVMDWAFDQYKLECVVAEVMPWNEASMHVLTKVGFENQGPDRYELFDSSIQTAYHMIVFTLTAQAIADG